MKNPIDNRTLMFIMWYTENTTVLSDNVRTYKGIPYYMDRRNSISDLWDVFIKEKLG